MEPKLIKQDEEKKREVKIRKINWKDWSDVKLNLESTNRNFDYLSLNWIELKEYCQEQIFVHR